VSPHIKTLGIIMILISRLKNQSFPLSPSITVIASKVVVSEKCSQHNSDILGRARKGTVYWIREETR
jgi:hypothetical protein